MNSSNTPEEAKGTFLAGYNCAQAVLSSHSEALGLDKNTAMKVACAFGAGMGRKEEVCGAVTGGLMVLGLRHGRGLGEEKAKTEDTYARTRAYMDAFKARHGSVLCRELIGCDLLTPEGQDHFKKNDLVHKVCATCVASAAELALA